MVASLWCACKTASVWASALLKQKHFAFESCYHHVVHLNSQVAFVGFAVQALVTREQPIEGLTKHLANPFGHNIIRYQTAVGS